MAPLSPPRPRPGDRDIGIPNVPVGVFIVLEGGDSCGKSTNTQRVQQWLEEAGYNVVVTREPGGTPLGAVIREHLLHPDSTIDARTEALLYAADRAHHVDHVIRPALAQGCVVVCDRYIDSSVAYQGAGRGLGEDTIRSLSEWGTYDLTPDLTILLDVDPEQAARRRGDSHDRIESESNSFHQKVRESFLAQATQHPKRYCVIDANADENTVGNQVVAAVQEVVDELL
ncbi:MAG: dTMP kinase [Actinomycetaceae bacterium]|nr:dTMP kinase [Actinomycetaceae bacterium]